MSEVVGTLEVCIVLDGFIDREVTVNLSTVNGTAIGIICISFIIWLKLFIIVELLSTKNRLFCALFDKSMKLGT